MDALIRLQDGYYVGRFPQLDKLVDASGSELIEYYSHRFHGRLPMTAADERTTFLLNNDMKHYRAICDFMQMAQGDCERVVESYKRWLTASRSRAWWNTGDVSVLMLVIFTFDLQLSALSDAGIHLPHSSAY